MSTKKAYFQNFSWFQIYVFKLSPDYVCSIAPIDYTVLNKVLCVRLSVKLLLTFHTEMISA